MTADQSRDTSSGWIPEPGTTLDGRYRLNRMVDRGGMGVIMSAEHLAMRREVAVKLLSPAVAAESGYRARFRREVDLAAKLEHPNIVRCYDFGETEDGVLYLVMELLAGKSLATALKRDGRMSLDRAAALMTQLVDGLTEAHMQDMVHRDLKPGNVYIVRDARGRETVKLLDFGLARLVSSDDARITKTGKICGTASYLPPEMLLTQENTMAGDVYACGLIMLELVLGRKVFSSWSTTQTFLQQLMLPARIPRRIYETPYGQLIARCLMKHPDDRPEDADVLYQQLSTMVGELPPLVLEESELPPPLNQDLVDSLIDDFNVGRIRTTDALRLLPTPEPFDADAPAIDETVTQRIVLSDIETYLSSVEEDMPTVRLTPTEVAKLSPPAKPEPRISDGPGELEPERRPLVAYGITALVVVALPVALWIVFSGTPERSHHAEPAAKERATASPTTVAVETPPREEAVQDTPDSGAVAAPVDAGRAPAAPPVEQPKKTIRRKKKRKPPVPATPTAEAVETPAEPKQEKNPATDALLDKYLKVGKPK